MAGASLLTLLDDIATVLDDVAVMTKVAARKTAGVLGDDLALNAQQVTGVRAEREIPVVWGVAKGSFKNKLILVPAALLISVIAPWLIQPMLLLGGLFLCFEGVEKIVEKLFHSEANTEDKVDVLAQSDVDIAEYEKEKIKGAIRTDFVLSAEIIVISLGVVQDHPFLTQAIVVSVIAAVMTAGVYGLVAGIVKLDDAGLYLVNHSEQASLKNRFGSLLVNIAPYLMKALAFVGTIAMFLVGGGIVVHTLPHSHEIVENIVQAVNLPGSASILPPLMNGIVGVIAGAAVVAVVTLINKIRGKKTH
ncbi:MULTISPECIES: DUF808 domain-containing protein [unclassified Photobacterium]|uniref:DUF808 domain-containing protein n=1 Tax=unclassified Photobacterium TaxID=2628852 RepID=UPI000D1555AA|nr:MULTISPECIES: DUF808 domain-containing protein [unclassified Photobacterium]PSV26420.1 DUF808 domain-containing protein [Photobacterium sp. GB-56]PSV31457.1 DUF808 domain-containing protein [Photobacterium sp. GB-72]PSV34805.1 DUF808 domain-containing protein [Photobacterium sp. GB-27]PSV36752.1 DUF808 domain-containing protein [Photobacterium sp. GB-210]PSV46004.1 DUF808 domain-containing protein [Photobacterium sp. GB-36]